MRKQIVLAALLAVFLAAPSMAQTVEENTDYRKLDRVSVKLVDSKWDMEGRLVGLSSDSVTVLLDGQQVSVPLANVRRIDVGGDPVSNGALIGGLIAGVWCVLICGQGLDSGDSVLGVVAANATIGALIGAGIDAAKSNRRTIYSAPARPKSIAPHFRPAFRVTLRF